jgi:tetratricopeptide (TPR) repeat protein
MQKDLDAVTSAKEPIGIALQELEATIAARAGDRKKAYELYRKAADREAAMLYTEPPAYPRPVVEGLGNVAMALGDYAVAEKAYRETLEREPGSGRAYFGLAAALDGLGRQTEARDARSRAAKAWANADATCRRCSRSRRRQQHRNSNGGDRTTKDTKHTKKNFTDRAQTRRGRRAAAA